MSSKKTIDFKHGRYQLKAGMTTVAAGCAGLSWYDQPLADPNIIPDTSGFKLV